MDTNSGLVGLIMQKMAYLNQRQSVLAENVANADTPGYVARDLSPFTFNDAMKQANVQMATTDARHIMPVSMSGVNTKSVKADAIETVPTGNTVDIEGQMMEVSKTAVEYKEMTSIYKTIGNLFKIALTGNSGS